MTVAAGGYYTMVGDSGTRTMLTWGLGFYGRLSHCDMNNRGDNLRIHSMAPRSPPNPNRPIPCPVATVFCARQKNEGGGR